MIIVVTKQRGKVMSAEKQIEMLANYIMAEIDGEPSQSEGAGECAIRIIKIYRDAMRSAMDNIGVPQAEYPAPVAEAYKILADTLNSKCRNVFSSV